MQSIEGLEGEDGDGGPRDWFFYVNGVESTVGAADYPLHGGEAIWWDYRDWGAAMRVPAVVGSWPQPFAGGYDGRRRPVAVECRGGGAGLRHVRRRLEDAGGPGRGGQAAPATRSGVLVGPWARLREDPAAAQIESGPQASGVFADFACEPGGTAAAGLQALDESGEPVAAASAPARAWSPPPAATKSRRPGS